MRIAVVGAGLAGALVAYRLVERFGVRVDVFTGPARADATAVSGGIVRAFETDLTACGHAALGIAELRADAALAAAAGYHEVGSVYLATDTDLAPRLRVVDAHVRGSAEVWSADQVRARFGILGLPPNAVAVVERHAGYLSPAALRSWALGRAVAGGAEVFGDPVVRVDGPALTTASGSLRRYDRVVVAAGPWTPRLVPGALGMRTRTIQFSLHSVGLGGLGAFVDEHSGLYGRPWNDHTTLLGVPTANWGVAPDRGEPDPAIAADVRSVAARVLGTRLSEPTRMVAAVDCFHDDGGGLRLRPVPDMPDVVTFTAGAGGAAKTALAASVDAAADLTGSGIPANSLN
ncbi:MAG: FAD-binding oxidoreductase [Actinomycetota bacterium]|nr:FAD-binding oxidoreductase [Actinomycetota bacterium]